MLGNYLPLIGNHCWRAKRAKQVVSRSYCTRLKVYEKTFECRHTINSLSVKTTESITIKIRILTGVSSAFEH